MDLLIKKKYDQLCNTKKVIDNKYDNRLKQLYRKGDPINEELQKLKQLYNIKNSKKIKNKMEQLHIKLQKIEKEKYGTFNLTIKEFHEERFKLFKFSVDSINNISSLIATHFLIYIHMSEWYNLWLNDYMTKKSALLKYNEIIIFYKTNIFQNIDIAKCLVHNLTSTMFKGISQIENDSKFEEKTKEILAIPNFSNRCIVTPYGFLNLDGFIKRMEHHKNKKFYYSFLKCILDDRPFIVKLSFVINQLMILLINSLQFHKLNKLLIKMVKYIEQNDYVVVNRLNEIYGICEEVTKTIESNNKDTIIYNELMCHSIYLIYVGTNKISEHPESVRKNYGYGVDITYLTIKSFCHKYYYSHTTSLFGICLRSINKHGTKVNTSIYLKDVPKDIYKKFFQYQSILTFD